MRRCSVSLRGFPVRLDILDRANPVAVAQEGGGARHAPLAGREPVAQLDRIAVGDADLDLADLDLAVSDDCDAGAAGALDHRRGRYADRDAAADLDAAAGERADARVGVGRERDPDLAEPGGLVDLARDQANLAARVIVTRKIDRRRHSEREFGE